MPVRACATRALTRAVRGRARSARLPRASPCCQQGHLHRFGAGDFAGLGRAFVAGLYAGLARAFCGPCWPDFGPCWAFARAVQCWAGRGRACNACFHCTNAQCWTAIQCAGYGLAYVLAYGLDWAGLALSVWLRLAGACLLSIHRIMKPC